MHDLHLGKSGGGSRQAKQTGIHQVEDPEPLHSPDSTCPDLLTSAEQCCVFFHGAGALSLNDKSITTFFCRCQQQFHYPKDYIMSVTVNKNHQGVNRATC